MPKNNPNCPLPDIREARIDPTLPVNECGDVCLFLHFGEYATAIFGSLWLD